MQTNVLDYRIIIEPEVYPDGALSYNAYCPTLGIADYGDSVAEALVNIKEAIKFTIECLADENKTVPRDNIETQLVTSAKISISPKLKLNFA
ncbi:MAG: type II toxin-antitoxin system HicB family antitoxin [Patescibacteria group bacterium]